VQTKLEHVTLATATATPVLASGLAPAAAPREGVIRKYASAPMAARGTGTVRLRRYDERLRCHL